MQSTTRQIDLYIYDGVNILDVSGISEAFYAASTHDKTTYNLRYMSKDGSPIRAACGLKLCADIGLDDINLGGINNGQDLVLLGGAGMNGQMHYTPLLEVIKNWQISGQDKRLISVCSGALILAASGVLDGHIATTHWSRADEAAQLYPNVKWQTDSIYTIEGHLFTSAGVTAGIDLALAIIAKDCGTSVALLVARELVVSLRRSGGQTQYSDILKAQYSTQNSLEALLELIVAQPDKDWTLDCMAEIAGMTSRTLSRKFRQQLDCSPVLYVEKIRVSHASNLLSFGRNMNKVAKQSGFGNLQRMQRSFERQIGISPTAYCKKFSEANQ
ncbi:MAG: helix-turn-helix domain-containing protein [Rhizobiales bacterium]|nr:helix-turn-helix domain-containing protein [Hyphomicrobiales bacterium]